MNREGGVPVGYATRARTRQAASVAAQHVAPGKSHYVAPARQAAAAQYVTRAQSSALARHPVTPMGQAVHAAPAHYAPPYAAPAGQATHAAPARYAARQAAPYVAPSGQGAAAQHGWQMAARVAPTQQYVGPWQSPAPVYHAPPTHPALAHAPHHAPRAQYAPSTHVAARPPSRAPYAAPATVRRAPPPPPTHRTVAVVPQVPRKIRGLCASWLAMCSRGGSSYAPQPLWVRENDGVFEGEWVIRGAQGSQHTMSVRAVVPVSSLLNLVTTCTCGSDAAMFCKHIRMVLESLVDRTAVPPSPRVFVLTSCNAWSDQGLWDDVEQPDSSEHVVWGVYASRPDAVRAARSLVKVQDFASDDDEWVIPTKGPYARMVRIVERSLV